MFEPLQPEQPINPPELTPTQEESLRVMEEIRQERIQREVERRAVDPEHIIDALIILLTDNPETGNRLAYIILNHGDRGINIANVKLDILDWLKFKVTKEIENGQL
jgi:predicted Mrr-cat superfamily restriction endonuclease